MTRSFSFNFHHCMSEWLDSFEWEGTKSINTTYPKTDAGLRSSRTCAAGPHAMARTWLTAVKVSVNENGFETNTEFSRPWKFHHLKIWLPSTECEADDSEDAHAIIKGRAIHPRIHYKALPWHNSSWCEYMIPCSPENWYKQHASYSVNSSTFPTEIKGPQQSSSFKPARLAAGRVGFMSAQKNLACSFFPWQFRQPLLLALFIFLLLPWLMLIHMACQDTPSWELSRNKSTR